MFLFFISCTKKGGGEINSSDENSTFISAIDISRYPEISNSNPVYYNLEGHEEDFLLIIKDNGVNTVRLRLWVNPVNEHSAFNEVQQFSKTLKSFGFKIWLTLHYSDSWADPGHQETPKNWSGLNFNQLKDSVYTYTEKIMYEIQPDFIQIGNEINTGLLHPNGHLINEPEQFIDLMETAISAVRKNANEAEIVIHFAGIDGADWFFSQVSSLDYDIIGLSFYPMWHGKSLVDLQNNMQSLSDIHNKKIVIAETAYPFTLDWNDWTNNIVGLQEQLILPEYPATIEGQRKFINQIKTITKELEKGVGFCYWGGELIAWKGTQSLEASTWENQALFDFDNNALPVLNEFKME